MDAPNATEQANTTLAPFDTRTGNFVPAAAKAATGGDATQGVVRRRMIEADQLFNRPWLITKAGLATLVAAWQEGREEERPSPSKELARNLKAAGIKLLYDFDDDEDDNDDDERERDYPMTEDGIACIPVVGPLTKASYWFGTSYADLQDMCRDAMEDDEVKAILLCCDSPGGEASSPLYDLSDYLFSARNGKPLCAISDDNCYSACYWLASAASKIFVNRAAGTGSIGVWTAHVSIEKMLQKAGVEVTYVFAGEKKVDGNQTQPLSDRARAEMQEGCDRVREAFVTAVSRNRGVSADALYKTEAGIFAAEKGIPLLCDAIGKPEDAIAYLRGQIASRQKENASAGEQEEEDNAAKKQLVNSQVSATANTGTTDVESWLAGIAALNGARGRAAIPIADRQSAYDKFAGQLKEAKVDPPALKTEAEVAAALEEMDRRYLDFEGFANPGSCTLLRFAAADLDTQQERILTHGPLAAAMLAELRALKAAYPNAIAAVRPAALVGQPQTGRRVSMLVVPYDGACATLGGFKELYQRGCFAEGLDNDPRALFNHNEERVLGRKSAGTTRFWEDAAGVHSESDAPETSWAEDLLVSMRRGDITQASAAFWILQHRWEMRGGDKVRIIEKALLREASVHAFAAYETTRASVAPAPVKEVAAHVEKSLAVRARAARARLTLNIHSTAFTAKEH